jgi:hypothetical protein
MKSKYSKWIPLTVYSNAMMTRYLLMARKNHKTGIISFKSVKVNRVTSHDTFLTTLEMSTQFNKLLEEVESK